MAKYLAKPVFRLIVRGLTLINMAKHLAKPVFSLICEEVALYHKLYSIVLYNFIQHCDLLTMGFRNRSRPEPEYLAGAVT